MSAMCVCKDSLMKIYIILISSFFLISISASGQRKLTKEEILQYFKTTHFKKHLSKDSIKLTWSDELNIKIIYHIDSLKKSGVDSLIVYSVSYPGYVFRKDSCTSNYGTSAFLITKKHGKVTIEEFKGRCYSLIYSDKGKELFSFYDIHYSQLNEEIIMPIIYSGQTNDKGGITHTMSNSFHEPKYSLYYDIGASYSSLTFGESDLNDRESLFYNYNLNSAVFRWWILITELVEQ